MLVGRQLKFWLPVGRRVGKHAKTCSGKKVWWFESLLTDSEEREWIFSTADDTLKKVEFEANRMLVGSKLFFNLDVDRLY